MSKRRTQDTSSPSPIDPSTCPVAQDAQQIQDLTTTTVKAMRKLRKDLRRCKTCSCLEDCPIKTNLHESIQAALDQIYEEWNLYDAPPVY